MEFKDTVLGKLLLAYPTDWRRLLFRAPIILWRMGLGPILGHSLLILTTTGRKSLRPRHTALEYYVLNGRLYVVAAYAPRAEWYRNLEADPRVTAQTWQGAESLRARRVTAPEELRDLFAVTRRNATLLDSYFAEVGVQPDPQDWIAHRDRLYILCLEATTDRTPPPLEVDLAWVWPVLLLLGMLRPRRRR